MTWLLCKIITENFYLPRDGEKERRGVQEIVWPFKFHCLIPQLYIYIYKQEDTINETHAIFMEIDDHCLGGFAAYPSFQILVILLIKQDSWSKLRA